MKSVLDKTVSCFKDYYDVSPLDISLLTFINSRKFKAEVDLIRSLENKEERDVKKALLPSITPSGTFTQRAEKYIIKHSGLVQIDIDYKGNEHIDNFEEIPKVLSVLPYLAYCGYSASGHGFWCIIPIAYPDKHKLHLQAIKNVFKSYGIKVDNAPSNIASLRGYSYDDSAYINHSAEPFTQITKPQEIRVIRNGNYEATTEQRFNRAIKKTQETELFIDGSKHCFLVKLAGYCNAIGIDYDTCVNLVEQNFRHLTTSDVDLEKPINNVYKGYKKQFAEYA